MNMKARGSGNAGGSSGESFGGVGGGSNGRCGLVMGSCSFYQGNEAWWRKISVAVHYTIPACHPMLYSRSVWETITWSMEPFVVLARSGIGGWLGCSL